MEILGCAATVKVGMLKNFIMLRCTTIIFYFLLSSKKIEGLMQLTLNTQKSNIGTCPHGLPLGSCPICNGMSGAGAKKADFSAKPGEMSWSECAAIGAYLKAQKLAKQTKIQDSLNFAQKLQIFQKQINSIQQKIILLNSMFSLKFPKIISLPIIFISQNLIIKPLNIIKILPQIIQNLNQKILDITSKITSVLGEKKTALIKQSSEFFKKVIKKFKSLIMKETNNETT